MTGHFITVPAGQLRLTEAAPVMIEAPTLVKLLELQANGKLKALDLARFLAAAQFGPTYQGTDAVSIPIQVLNLIGERLIAPSEWVKEVNATRVRTADQKASSWQEQADEIWRQHPQFSRTVVAKLINLAKFNTIRLKITPPKK